ncbi:MAG: TolC family protein [Treponema sp.]|jgi:outer membrane protein TolC|nr:TolC family protein [Treponema sp.]
MIQYKRLNILCFYLLFSGSICIAEEVIFHSSDEAVAFALQNSKRYYLEKQNVLQNMKAAKMSIQNFLPVFDFSFSETDSTNLLSSDSRTKNIQANVTQELFSGGKRKLEYDMNQISALYSYYDYEISERNFSSAVTSQYYQYLIQVESVKIKMDMLNTARVQLEIMEKEVALGMTLQTDYIEYHISYINMENEHTQSVRDLKNMERKFKAAVELSEQAELIIEDKIYSEAEYFYYEPHITYIWDLVKEESNELRKQDLSVEYSKKQLNYGRRWYIPTISIQGGISFSGRSYPLTEPKYSAKLILSFLNNKLFPVSISGGYGLDRDRLYNINNSSNVTIMPQPVYGITHNIENIAILKTNIERSNAEKELKDMVYDTIISHDNSLRNANTAERTIGLLEKRIEFSAKELKNGRITHIDHLEKQLRLSETKLNSVQYRIQAANIERNLEILTGMPFGGLRNLIAEND